MKKTALIISAVLLLVSLFAGCGNRPLNDGARGPINTPSVYNGPGANNGNHGMRDGTNNGVNNGIRDGVNNGVRDGTHNGAHPRPHDGHGTTYGPGADLVPNNNAPGNLPEGRAYPTARP